MFAQRVRLAGGFLLLLPLLALGATGAGAQPLVYEHDGQPLFSLQVPEGWQVDLDFSAEAREAGVAEGEEPLFEIVEISPGDDSHVWFGVWALADISTLDQGLTYLGSLRGDLFTDLEASEPMATELGGMAARTISGTAKREGESVELAMALFAPRENSVVAILYVGAPDAWRSHEEALAGIMASLEPAGQ